MSVSATVPYLPYTEPEGFQGDTRLDAECRSCYEKLKEGAVVGHPFGKGKELVHLIHETCMKKWIQSQGHNCPECRAEVNLADFLTPEELQARENVRRRNIPPIRQHSNLSSKDVVLVGAIAGGVFACGGHLMGATAFALLTAIFQGLPAAGMIVGTALSDTLTITTLGIIGGTAGAIMGIAVARFFGYGNEEAVFGIQPGILIMIVCDLQIKSIALGIFGIAGLGAAVIAMSLAGKAVQYVYSRVTSQVQEQ